jgi:hypothetical protein
MKEFLDRILVLTNSESDSETEFFGHEIASIFKLGEELLSKADTNISPANFVEFTSTILSSYENVLKNEDAWNQLLPVQIIELR